MLLAVKVAKRENQMWQILCVYANGRNEGEAMKRTAEIFMNNRSQAVRRLEELQFNAREVYIRKEGNDIILSPRPLDWNS